MLLSTTPFLYGVEIKETKGLVFADVVYGANVGKDLIAKIKDFTGGQVGGYQGLYSKARKKALDEMIRDAEKMGADAIVGIDFQINSLGKENTILQLSAHGTAVITLPLEESK